MAENIDDLTIDYSEDDRLIVKQVDKAILTRGNWTTIMYLFQEMDKNTGEYGANKVSIRRYQKRGGVYRQQSKFNISSAKQGMQIVDVLNKWFVSPGAAAEASSDQSQDDGDDASSASSS